MTNINEGFGVEFDLPRPRFSRVLPSAFVFLATLVLFACGWVSSSAQTASAFETEHWKLLQEMRNGDRVTSSNAALRASTRTIALIRELSVGAATSENDLTRRMCSEQLEHLKREIDDAIRGR